MIKVTMLITFIMACIFSTMITYLIINGIEVLSEVDAISIEQNNIYCANVRTNMVDANKGHPDYLQQYDEVCNVRQDFKMQVP